MQQQPHAAPARVGAEAKLLGKVEVVRSDVVDGEVEVGLMVALLASGERSPTWRAAEGRGRWRRGDVVAAPSRGLVRG